jgi:Na+/H+-dicarboxylate symporter
MSTLAATETPRPRVPLFLMVLGAAALGVALGLVLGPRTVLGVSAASLGDAGTALIRVLKMIATPLIFLAVLDAALNLTIPARKAAWLLAIAALNAAVATALGLGVANLLQLGHGAFTALSGATNELAAPSVKGSLLPTNIVAPFADNAVLTVVGLALLAGLALRAVRSQHPRDVEAVASLVRGALAACAKALGWIVMLVPVAVFGVIAHLVASSGLAFAGDLMRFTGTIALGIVLHGVVYYALILRLVARRSPRAFLGGAADAIATAASCGSSMATLPVTLRCLQDLGVSQTSSRVAACAGTNLNHDGIILYEAAAAVFVAQACGLDLGLGQQLGIAVASVVAGIGVAGVPEAGLVTLPLVLGAAGIPTAVVSGVVPALLPVDWLVGRMRAATNVASDMVVAATLDRVAPERAVAHG